MQASSALNGLRIINDPVCIASFSFCKKAHTRGGFLPLARLWCLSILLLLLLPGRAQDTLDLVKAAHYIGPGQSFFSGITDSIHFGVSIAGLGDLDGDGVGDIAVGQHGKATGTGVGGSVWVLLLNDDGTVKDTTHIKSNASGFSVTLAYGDQFGARIANIGDLNEDGFTDIAVGAWGDDDGGTNHGAVYILFLKDTVLSGTTTIWVKDYQKISDTEGDFTASMANHNEFVGALGAVGDLNGDDIQDIAVGAKNSDDGGSSRGACWILLLDTDGTVKGYRKYNSNSTWPGSNPINVNSNQFGQAAVGLGDLDNDDVNDIAITSYIRDNKGAIYVMFLNSDGTIKAYQKIGTSGAGGLQTSLSTGGNFGFELANIGDLNGDGVVDMLAGMRLHDDGYTNAGGAIVLYLNTNGTVQYEEVISQTQGLASGVSLGLHAEAWAGTGLAYLGDLDGDDGPDLAMGVRNHNGGGTERGRVLLLELNPKPIVNSYSVSDESASAPGSITMETKGGVRPYTYLWNGAVTEDILEGVSVGISEADFATVGLEDTDFDLPYDEYLEFLAPDDLDDLTPGIYPLTIVGGSSTWTGRFLVGTTMATAVSTGCSVTGKTVQKTASDSWTNMRYVSTNVLPLGSDGWVSFRAGQTTGQVAVGLSEVGASQSSGYQQMKYAIYLDGTTVKLWYDNSLHTASSVFQPFNTSNVFLIERKNGQINFMKDEYSMALISGADMDEEYQADVAIYKNGGQVKDLSASYSAEVHMKIKGHVESMSCDGDGTGSVDITVGPLWVNFGDLTFEWTGPEGYPGSTEDDIEGLVIPGIYHVHVEGTYDSEGYEADASFVVGYSVSWTERLNCVVDPDQPNTLESLSLFPGECLPGTAASSNQVSNHDGQWIYRELPANAFGSLCYSLLYPIPMGIDQYGFQNLITGQYGTKVTVIEYYLFPWVFIKAESATPSDEISYAFAYKGDRLWMKADGTDLEIQVLDGLSWPNLEEAFPSTAEPIRLFAKVLGPGGSIDNAVCSFSCGETQRAVLRDDLEDGYHRADNGWLHIAYREDYVDQDELLDFAVHDKEGNVVITSADQAVPVAFGYNQLDIEMIDDTDDELQTGYYWLEVTNEKGIKQYLRFKYDSTSD